MDIVFLIDGSGSIGQSDFKQMKNFVRAVMDQFKGTNTLVKTGSPRPEEWDGGAGSAPGDDSLGGGVASRGWLAQRTCAVMRPGSRVQARCQRRANLSPDLRGPPQVHLIGSHMPQTIGCFAV